MLQQSSIDGTLWRNLQLTPLAQHPLAKKRQQKAPPFSLNRSAAVQPTSSSGLHFVSAASFSFSSLAQMYLLNQKLYSSSPSLQVQLFARLVSTCFRAGLSMVSVKTRYFFFSFLTYSLGMCLQMLQRGSVLFLKEARYVCTLSWSSLGSCQTDSLFSVLKQQFFLFYQSKKIWQGLMSSLISFVFIDRNIALIKYQHLTFYQTMQLIQLFRIQSLCKSTHLKVNLTSHMDEWRWQILSITFRHNLLDIISCSAGEVFHVRTLTVKVRKYYDLLLIELTEVLRNYHVIVGISIVQLDDIVISTKIVCNLPLEGGAGKPPPEKLTTFDHHLVRFGDSSIQIKESSLLRISLEFPRELFLIVLFELFLNYADDC